MRLITNGNNYFSLKKEDIKENNTATPKDKKLFEKVVKYIKNKDSISISLFQCEFSVGYIKGKQIMEQLIAEGYVTQVEEFKYVVNKKD